MILQIWFGQRLSWIKGLAGGLLSLALLVGIGGCGGTGAPQQPPPPPNPPTISSISPSSATAGQAGFTLTVNGSNFVQGAVVQWNGNARNTTFVSTAQLTAAIPANDIAATGSAQVTVQNPAPDNRTSNTAALSVTTPPPIAVSVSPANASVPVNTTQQFTATVTNDLVNQGITWSLSQGGNACSPGCGTLNSTTANPVAYTAPSTVPVSPTVTITAAAVADPSKTATTTVTVTLPIMTISPASEVLGPDGARFFTARILGLSDQSVIWSVQEGTAGGTITSDGLYTAPAVTGAYHLVATSVANNSVTATAQITIMTAGFKPIASMKEARELPTATVLQDGRVLVTGGGDNQGNGQLASAELFDPATGAFSTTGSMSTARLRHTSTLLHNGKVLVVGGFDPNGAAVASAELFDSATNTFSVTGSLTTPRAGHTANLLADGRVLVAGGFTGQSDQLTATAEIYDPNTGQFTRSPSLNTARWKHTATLLGNGKLLVVGGFMNYNASNATSSAELFDPASGSFSPTANTSDARGDHSATLLSDGRVLIAGGWNNLGLADDTEFELFSTAELYDPATGTFQPTGAMANARLLHTAIRLPGGKVLLSGGYSLDGLLATAELFDPQTGSFTSTGSLEMGLQEQAAALLNDGRVLALGGSKESRTSVPIAEVYH